MMSFMRMRFTTLTNAYFIIVIHPGWEDMATSGGAFICRFPGYVTYSDRLNCHYGCRDGALEDRSVQGKEY